MNEKSRYWLQGEEDIFLDPTTCAMAFRILRLNGYDVSSGWIIYKYLSACLEFLFFRREKKKPKKLILCCIRAFADPFYQYSEDKFANSLKGYLEDASAVIELYKASQVIIHPDESVLFKQSSWTRHFLEHDSSTYQFYADKLRIYVDNEVVSCFNLL